MVSRCTSCGARILWCRTETGRRIPVNPTPDPEGNLILIGTETAMPTAKAVSRAGRTPGKLTYKSHFATCSDPKKHRRRDHQQQPENTQDDLFT